MVENVNMIIRQMIACYRKDRINEVKNFYVGLIPVKYRKVILLASTLLLTIFFCQWIKVKERLGGC